MLHFPPTAPPRRVTDGLSCRQTITAEAFDCIPLVFVEDAQWSDGRAHVFIHAALLVLLLVVHIRKEYSPDKFEFLHGANLVI